MIFDGSTSEVVELIDKNGFKILQISIEHIVAYEELELTHRDPFDRILVAQVMVEKMAIITRDENIHRYQVKTLW